MDYVCCVFHFGSPMDDFRCFLFGSPMDDCCLLCTDIDSDVVDLSCAGVYFCLDYFGNEWRDDAHSLGHDYSTA